MSELYKEFYNKIGSKVTISNGSLVLDDNGFLLVSNTPAPGTIFIDNFKKSAQLIPLKNDLRGVGWNLFTNNCAICCAKWHDNKFGTKLLPEFRGLTSAEKQIVMETGYDSIFKDYGFEEVSEISTGCILVYEFNNHLAIVIDNNTILQHLARKYSSIDPLDLTKVQKILCYSKTLIVQQ
jgi:hypothetical protein